MTYYMMFDFTDIIFVLSIFKKNLNAQKFCLLLCTPMCIWVCVLYMYTVYNSLTYYKRFFIYNWLAWDENIEKSAFALLVKTDWPSESIHRGLVFQAKDLALRWKLVEKLAFTRLTWVGSCVFPNLFSTKSVLWELNTK